MKPPKLIAITQTIETMTPEESICYMARVSSPQNQDKHDTSFKLLKYLVVNSHWSPFDMVDMIVEIHTSRAIMAQILRHWSFRFQEFSQRYSSLENIDLIDWTHLEAREKASTNRQGSGQRLPDETFHIIQSAKACESSYYDALKHNVAPECARMVLPLGTPTRAYMKGSVRSWITYFWQRLDLHAQKEHRELADQMFEIFESQFPNIAKLVKDGKPGYISYEDMAIVSEAKEAKLKMKL